MSFVFRPAQREAVGLVLGFTGPSGGGKSYTALRVASGLAGERRFAAIDTEAGRLKHYADRFAFDHGDLTAPFSPEHYLEAIIAAEAAGYPVILVDSMSHEHAGDGGLLDMQEAELTRMAGQDWQKREACKMAAWVRPKQAHKKMVSRLLQLRAHLILTFRAEQKVDVVRVDGRMQVVPKKLLSGFSDWIPVCEKNILYELTASFLLTPDKPGIPQPIKLQEQHRAFFPLDQPISEESGRRLGEWAKGGTLSRPATGAPTPSAPVSEPGAAAGGAPAADPVEADVVDLIRQLEQAASLKAGQDVWGLASKREFWEQLTTSQQGRLAAAKDAMKARLKAA
jgi:hypothetical protein